MANYRYSTNKSIKKKCLQDKFKQIVTQDIYIKIIIIITIIG
jgi:hypothetical protein